MLRVVTLFDLEALLPRNCPDRHLLALCVRHDASDRKPQGLGYLKVEKGDIFYWELFMYVYV